jgi:ATP-binding cassette subfamily C protein
MCIVGMLLVVVLTMGRSGEFQTIIPTLSLFAMAAFRIIPAMGRIFNAATQIRYHSYSLDAVCNDMSLLDKTVNLKTSSASSSEKVICFDEAIELKDVYYQYPNAKKSVLIGVSLTIPKQYSVGLVGPSGAGKTTIIDVIVGLLIPTQGEVLVDSKSIKDNLLNWQRMIGYIPQNIYLSDDTVRRNIAFGLADEKIDEEQVWSVLASAQLEKFVKSLPEGLDTFIGERGIRLSGGQRQLIGIARALYHNPEVLIMDEGTASLDNETEWEIMQAVRNLSGTKTIIIVAHRLGTVKSCDRLYFIRDSKVADYGTYEELFDKSQEFKAMAMATEYKTSASSCLG